MINSSKWTKLICCLIAAFMFVSLFAGCSQKQEKQPDTTEQALSSSEQKTTETTNEEKKQYSGEIVVAMAQPPGYAEAWNALAEAYKKYQPNVKVVVEPKPMDKYNEWLTAQVSAGDARIDIVDPSTAMNATEWIDMEASYFDSSNPYAGGLKGSEIINIATQGALKNRKLVAITSEQAKFGIMYNKDIFDKLGLKVPNTWDEFVSVCETISKAGYIPLSMTGDLTSFWYGQFAYFLNVYTDQYTRDKIKYFVAQKGDFNYEPERDGKWTFNPNDPFNDIPGVTYTDNIARALKAIGDKQWRFDTPEIKELYMNFKKVFPKYVPSGWQGIDGTQSVQLFMQQKAAMLVDGSWRVVLFAKDMADVNKYDSLDEDRKKELAGVKPFNAGIMHFPSMTGEYVQAPARDITIGATNVGAVKKTQEHDEMVMDFLKFYASPEGFSIYFKAIYDSGNIPAGIPLIKDVQIPDDLKALEELDARGNAQNSVVWLTKQGYGPVQESVREFADYTQQFFDDKISIDEFLKRHQANFDKYFDKVVESYGYTKDELNNPEREPKKK